MTLLHEQLKLNSGFLVPRYRCFEARLFGEGQRDMARFRKGARLYLTVVRRELGQRVAFQPLAQSLKVATSGVDRGRRRSAAERALANVARRRIFEGEAEARAARLADRWRARAEGQQ